jgi:hypothetical protein
MPQTTKDMRIISFQYILSDNDTTIISEHTDVMLKHDANRQVSQRLNKIRHMLGVGYVHGQAISVFYIANEN